MKTLQKVQISFEKRTSRKAKISFDGFKDLSLTGETLEDSFSIITEIISKSKDSVLVSVNYCNSGSIYNNYSFVFSKEDFEKIKDLSEYFKNLTEKKDSEIRY